MDTVLTYRFPSALVFLKTAFEAQWHRGRPLSETIALCERIRKAIPAVNKIWGFNPFGILKVHMHQLADWMTRAMEGVLEGKYTLDTPSVLPFSRSI